jgi:DNA end-binding protein Ku
VAPGIGAVKAEDIKKGLEVSKGQYILFDSDELEDLKVDPSRTLDMVQFVDHCEIEPIWYEKPYFVLPDGEVAEEPFGDIRDARRATKKVGIGQFVMRGRDYVGALKPCGNGLMLETLRFVDEVRSASEIFQYIEVKKPEKELLSLAAELIQRKASPYAPEAFEDRYEKAVREIVSQRKAVSQLVMVDESSAPKGGAKVIDLIDALKRSMSAVDDKPARRARAPRAKVREAS